MLSHSLFNMLCFSGTGRMAHLKNVNRRFKNGFREGGAAAKKTKAE